MIQLIDSGSQQTNYLAAKGRAKKLARDRVKFFAPILAVQDKVGQIRIKDLSSRWGSCSSQGNLNFHFKIIFLPADLADYVIVHELAHLLEMNHSHRFWGVVQSVIPDYRKKILAVRRLEKDFFQEYRARPRRLKNKIRTLIKLWF